LETIIMENSGIVYVVSSACHGAGNCVAAGLLPTGEVSVRDTKRPDGQPQVYTAAEWDAFVQGVKSGEFDRGALPQPTR
jgi:hypothetical protein